MKPAIARVNAPLRIVHPRPLGPGIVLRFPDGAPLVPEPPITAHAGWMLALVAGLVLVAGAVTG